LNLPFF